MDSANPGHWFASPTELVRADQLEPGDLILGPDRPEPVRVWWRTTHPTHAEVLLAGSSSTDPESWALRPDAPVLIAGRVAMTERSESATRILTACRGALWLRQVADPHAPDGSDFVNLMRGYQALTERTHVEVVTDITAGMPAHR